MGTEEFYGPRKGKKCVIYVRVSTERQVQGYSLDGQIQHLADFAKFEGMEVLDVYIEAGASGKNVTGREAFQRMLSDISSGKIKTDFVIVYKLSRFGRNAKDILNSLTFLKTYGVNLICKEDSLDSSTSTGQLMITILSGVAEVERENIIIQSKLGREQKAKMGGWNGGIAPYGYNLINGKLIINPQEAKIVQYCFETFVNNNIGYSTLHSLLNRQGIPRDLTAEEHTYWEVRHIRIMLQNPVYTGRIAYGRRRQERIEGTEGDYRRVKCDDYILSDEPSHEAIISEELFQKAQMKLEDRRISIAPQVGKPAKYILSSILRCPMCGGSMVSDIVSWTNRGGERKVQRYYQCANYSRSKYGKCKKNAIKKEQIEEEVIGFTKMLIRDPQFMADIEALVGQKVDVTEIEAELTGYQKRLKQLNRSKSNLERDIDGIFDEDDFAERKRQDLNNRLNRLYEEIYSAERQIADCEQRKAAVEKDNLVQDNIQQMLYAFSEFFDEMDDEDKRMIIKSLIAEIHLRPKEEWKQGCNPLKEIVYNFPLENDPIEIFRGNTTSVHAVIRAKPTIAITTHIAVTLCPSDSFCVGMISCYILKLAVLRVSISPVRSMEEHLSSLATGDCRLDSIFPINNNIVQIIRSSRLKAGVGSNNEINFAASVGRNLELRLEFLELVLAWAIVFCLGHIAHDHHILAAVGLCASVNVHAEVFTRPRF